MMRLLVIVGVLLCTLQFCEPASAHTADQGAAYSLGQDSDERRPSEPAKKVAHSGHDHCCIASDQHQVASTAQLAPASEPPFSATVVQRPSRVLPPLLDPPLA
ncbi:MULTISPECIES: hypothetical protein [unclassified Sphingopyxis]|uniref:hypothetical protein n=1 Tax=unclassified Sphingopyxis TaxID=2614943 RepID=UPI001140CB70|nr:MULTISPECIES: hypothetical protein [unclassified Sphingopyxis]MCW5645895.1 hypothetical protein [Sphingopyxis sp.]HET6525502.1 hypothetical protein [Sphingopyxis sp.]HMP43566.1 hypothetical protein [Sphingopyxis sp.]HMQ17579.1 hypothetical protein [Sphingopyxis sp.]